MINQIHTESDVVSSSRDFAGNIKSLLTISPRMLLSLTSAAAAVAAAYHGVLAAMPLDLLPDGRNRIVVGTAADSPRLPTSASCQCYFPAAECRRLLCRVALPHQTTLPVGSTRLAVTGLIAKCADMFPLVSDYPHICFLFNLLLQMLLMVLVLLSRSRSAHGHAVRLKIPVPLRTARVSSIILPSRSFSCCCTSY